METNLPKFAKEVQEARDLLEQCTDLFREDVLNFTEEVPKAIKRVRDMRMTINREKTLTVETLGDLRKFFLEKDHEEEVRRLREFVSLCERMKKLADDGTLEKVSDVMLKLEGIR